MYVFKDNTIIKNHYAIAHLARIFYFCTLNTATVLISSRGRKKKKCSFHTLSLAKTHKNCFNPSEQGFIFAKHYPKQRRIRFKFLPSSIETYLTISKTKLFCTGTMHRCYRL